MQRADRYREAILAALAAEAGRPLTEREVDDAIEHFGEGFWEEDDYLSDPLGKVRYYPDWHRGAREGYENVFSTIKTAAPSEFGEWLEKFEKKIASKIKFLHFQTTLSDEPSPVPGDQPDAAPVARRLVPSIEPEPSPSIALTAGRTGHRAGSRPNRAEASPLGRAGAHRDLIAVRPPGIVSGGKLASLIRSKDKIGRAKLLAEFAAALESLDGVDGVASIRRDVRRLTASLRVTSAPWIPDRRAVAAPAAPQVKAAGGKTGQYAPLD